MREKIPLMCAFVGTRQCDLWEHSTLKLDHDTGDVDGNCIRDDGDDEDNDKDEDEDEDEDEGEGDCIKQWLFREFPFS
jgi:hypothetical protein